MPSFGIGNPLKFGKCYPCSSQGHRFTLNYSPSCTAPSPLHPTAVPKCSPLPKSHGSSFSTQGRTFIAAKEKHHISFQNTSPFRSSCPTLGMKCVSHHLPELQAKAVSLAHKLHQGIVRIRELSLRLNLNSLVENSIKSCAPRQMCWQNPWWCWIEFPLRTLPSRGINSGEQYHFKDIPMKQIGLLTNVEPKSGERVWDIFLCIRWGSVFQKSTLQTKERKALGFICQRFLAKLPRNWMCSKPDVPCRTPACEGLPSQIKLRCSPKAQPKWWKRYHKMQLNRVFNF